MSKPHLELEIQGIRHRMVADDHGRVSIGRQPGCTLVLNDDRVSRQHCILERTAQGWHVRDLNSRNGIRLNGQKVMSGPLHAGDVLKIGGVEMIVWIPKQPPPEAVPLIPDHRDHGDEQLRRGPQLPRQTVPFLSPVPDSNEPLPVEEPAAGSEEEEDGAGEYLAILQRLADMLPDPAIDAQKIDLIQARGHVLHASDEKTAASADAVRLLRILLMISLRIRSTDIHVEATRENQRQVRMRVDGMMVDIVRLPQGVGNRLDNLVKVLCDLDIAQKNAIQEGHFAAGVPGRRVDFRVSFTPAVHGQKLVARVLDLAWSPRYTADLALPAWMHDRIRQVVRQDSGMLLVCGPTGSGKTSTVYAILRDLDIRLRNLVTIEDPVEYQMEGVTQIPIQEDQGHTFSSVLRSVLRQDPDILLVGEVRDAETAKIAMQAAGTGHLVLSTIHAKDTLGALFRLLDLGVEPFLVGSAVNLILAQRLVRLLCPHCKQAVKPKPQDISRLNRQTEGLAQMFIPVGCPRCLHTGYSGRRAIYELLSATEEIRDVILRSPTMQDLKKALRNTVFTTLSQAGGELVINGLTSLDEIDRVVGTS